MFRFRYLALAAYAAVAAVCIYAFPDRPGYALIVLPTLILGGLAGVVVSGSILIMGFHRR